MLSKDRLISSMQEEHPSFGILGFLQQMLLLCLSKFSTYLHFLPLIPEQKPENHRNCENVQEAHQVVRRASPVRPVLFPEASFELSPNVLWKAGREFQSFRLKRWRTQPCRKFFIVPTVNKKQKDHRHVNELMSTKKLGRWLYVKYHLWAKTDKIKPHFPTVDPLVFLGEGGLGKPYSWLLEKKFSDSTI